MVELDKSSEKQHNKSKEGKPKRNKLLKFIGGLSTGVKILSIVTIIESICIFLIIFMDISESNIDLNYTNNNIAISTQIDSVVVNVQITIQDEGKLSTFNFDKYLRSANITTYSINDIAKDYYTNNAVIKEVKINKVRLDCLVYILYSIAIYLIYLIIIFFLLLILE